jgi:hypothetical protein
MPSTAFGPFALAYAARLPSSLSLLVFDEYGFAEALDSAIERAYHSGPFQASPIIADRRAAFALDAARATVNAERVYWKRREG